MAVNFTSDLARFPANTDDANWSQFPDKQQLVFHGLPTVGAQTDGGLGFQIRITNSHLVRRTQDGGPSWVGSFTPGEPLLFTDSSPGPLHFLFDDPVRGAGTQMNIKDPVAHVAFGISAFDENDDPIPLLHGGTAPGGFSSAADGTATFVGVADNLRARPRIKRIALFLSVLDSGYRGDGSFAINRLRLVP